MNPRLSVILPVFNRVSLLAHPLESLRTAAAATPDLDWELIVVDDGSTENVSAALATYPDLPARLHRLPKNSGLLNARLQGLQIARGEAVFFLDGDDAITPGKFSTQLALLDNADVVHGDMARCALSPEGRPVGPLRVDAPARPTIHPADFYLSLQPAPHDPLFRRAYLIKALRAPVCPPERAYDAIAETWFYYHLAIRPARIAYCPGVWSIVGEPAGERLSHQWERQCSGAMHLMQSFLAGCPITPETSRARRLIGRAAFSTWRALPHGFAPADRLLAIWRCCPPSPPSELGGRFFALAARLVGPVLAGRLFRRLQRPAYSHTQTVSPTELRTLFP